MSPRLERILLNFALEQDHQIRFPEQVALFKNIRAMRQDWGIFNALVRAGLDGHHHEFQEAVKTYWKKHFFSNHYLQYDKPYEGAVPFVQAAQYAGAQIYYLTGRDVHRMQEGTEQTLKSWGFPLSENKLELVMKPHASMDDAEFKKNWFQETLIRTSKTPPTRIWFFENEPLNIELTHGAFPDMNIIFLDTTHAGMRQPPESLPKIMNYLCDLDL